MMRPSIICIAAPTLAAAIASGQDMSDAHRQWIEQDVSAIATMQETQLFNELASDADRDRFQTIFWLRRDPSSNTAENEFRIAHEERIEIANEQIRGHRIPGSRTDMGQVFLLFGFPSKTGTSRTATGASEKSSTSPSQMVEGSTSEVTPPTGGGDMSTRMQTWLYEPDPALGLSEPLEIQFRATPSLGYRLVGSDALAEIFESRRESFIVNPGIGYERDAAGNLLPPAVSSEATAAAGLLDALLETKAASDTLPFSATPAFFRSREGETYVPVLFELDASDLEETDEGEYDLTFFGALSDAKGEIAARFEERVWLAKDDSARFEVPLQVAPGDYTAHLGVLDESSGAHGSRVAVIQVPGFGADDMSFSSVVLYRHAAKSGEPGGVPGRAFQFSSVKLEPIGKEPFRKADSLGVFFYVYGAESQELTARYVFFQGDTEKAQTRPQDLLTADRIALGSDEIPLAGFAPGDYTVVIHVEDKSSGKTITSRARFVLEP